MRSQDRISRASSPPPAPPAGGCSRDRFQHSSAGCSVGPEHRPGAGGQGSDTVASTTLHLCSHPVSNSAMSPPGSEAQLFDSRASEGDSGLKTVGSRAERSLGQAELSKRQLRGHLEQSQSALQSRVTTQASPHCGRGCVPAQGPSSAALCSNPVCYCCLSPRLCLPPPCLPSALLSPHSKRHPFSPWKKAYRIAVSKDI